MTAKEREILEDNLSPEIIDEWGGTITKLMRLHTRHIAEQAVGEEREACAKIAESFEPDEKLNITYASSEIRKRSRIKKLTNEDTE